MNIGQKMNYVKGQFQATQFDIYKKVHNCLAAGSISIFFSTKSLIQLTREIAGEPLLHFHL